MDRATAIRAMALYAPVAAAIVLGHQRPGGRRLLGACLVGIAWTVPTLLAIQSVNIRLGWWQFHAQGGLLRGMPVDLFLGWAVLWCAIPILAFRRVGVPWVIAIFLAIDFVLTPACHPVVELSSRWLIGESVALAFVLIPAQLFARWTLNDSHLYARLRGRFFYPGASSYS